MATTGSSSTSAIQEVLQANKASAKKAPAKKSSPAPRKRASAPRAEADRPPNPGRIAAEAARQLLELTGKEAEGVIGLDRSDDGWKVQVEVVEVRRIPDTTDVLAHLRGRGRRQGLTAGVPTGPPLRPWRPGRRLSVTESPNTGVTSRPYSAPMAQSDRPHPANLADILERVLDKGIIIAGDIRVNLLDIELLTIKIRLLVVSVDKAKEMGIDWWRNDPMLSTTAQGLAEENRQLRERLEELEEGSGDSSEEGSSG